MEKDDEIKGEGNNYDYGARLFDPRIGRWFSTDALESKYPYLSTYSYASNNPILNIDFDGNDWGYSTFKKDGKTYIKIIFIGAILNSSGKDINMKKLIANQKKEFEKVFGQGNVVTAFHVREIKSKDELKWNEHLIEIKKPESFKKVENPEEGESFEGGHTAYGGKYIPINSKGINLDGSLVDNKTIIHEIGHTAGLVHVFDFEKDFKKSTFLNGDKFSIGVQAFNNPQYNLEKEANFMNYSSEAVKNMPANYIWDDSEAINYFNDNVGKATRGQTQQIKDNIEQGHLNSNKDIPKI